MFIVIFLTLAPVASAAVPDGDGTCSDLIELFRDFQLWKNMEPDDGNPDYSPMAIKRRLADLCNMQRHMQEMGVKSWSAKPNRT